MTWGTDTATVIKLRQISIRQVNGEGQGYLPSVLILKI